MTYNFPLITRMCEERSQRAGTCYQNFLPSFISLCLHAKRESDVCNSKNQNELYGGESADLGNTFWQAHFGKNRKMHLGRGLVKTSTEVLISRSRFYQALDRGFVQPSTEVFKYLGRGFCSVEGLTNPRSRFR